MTYTVETRILELNFLEFLTSFLEGKVDLAQIFQLNERIYTKNHAALSQPLIKISTELHELKEKIDRGAAIENEAVMNVINDCVLLLIESDKKRRD